MAGFVVSEGCWTGIFTLGGPARFATGLLFCASLVDVSAASASVVVALLLGTNPSLSTLELSPRGAAFFSIQCLENVALDSSGGAGIIRQVLTPIIHQELMTRYSAFGQSHHNVSRVIRGGRDARLR